MDNLKAFSIKRRLFLVSPLIKGVRGDLLLDFVFLN